MRADPKLQSAVDVIRQTDPDTYAKMAASPWTVHAIATGHEPSLFELARERGPLNALSLLYQLDTAFGVTLSTPDEIPMWLTFINAPSIVAKAESMGVPAVDFAADVLVHEFTHNGDGSATVGEPEAFTAGTAFAHLLPPTVGGPIARLSEDTRKYAT